MDALDFQQPTYNFGFNVVLIEPVLDCLLHSTSPGERLSFRTDGVHWAEMLTFTLLNVFLDACSST